MPPTARRRCRSEVMVYLRHKHFCLFVEEIPTLDLQDPIRYLIKRNRKLTAFYIQAWRMNRQTIQFI
jgi:hypothetical protein